MADQPKQPWYKSIPGILTAATGLIAALSGLVAGLNQLGAFRREPPAEVVVRSPPAPADHTAQDSGTAGAALAEDSSASRPATSPQPTLPPTPSAPSAAPPPAAGAKPSPAPGAVSASDTTSPRSIVIPQGTAILLTVASRTCAPPEGSRRFTARVASPVEVHGATALPTGSAAALRLRRAGDSPIPRARLDSLARSGRALPVSSAQVQVPRASVSGSCLKPGGHLTAVLGEAVTVPGS